MLPETVASTAIVGIAILAGVLGIGLVVVAWQRRETNAAREFIVFVLGVSAWNFTVVALWLSPTFKLTVVFWILTLIFAVVKLTGWVLFVVAYTGQRERFRGWRRTLYFTWAAMLAAAFASNPVTKLVLADMRPTYFQGLTLVKWRPTPFSLANIVIIFIIVMWTYWLLIDFYRSAVAGQRKQALIILFAESILAAVNLLYYSGGLSSYLTLDPSPIIFIVMVTLIGFALFYYDFLNVEPLATNLLFKQMSDPVIVLNEDGDIISTNDAAADFLPSDADSLDGASPALRAALDGGDSQVTLDFDDSERTFDLKDTPIHDHLGRERGSLVVLRDITAEKRRQRKLERQNERLDEFAAVVSHDLRNPLHTASGYLELGRETGEDADFEKVSAAHERMETMIDDLLTMARAGGTVEETETVSLEQIAESAWETAHTDGGSLLVDLPRDAGVVADPDLLQQLFENCFRNATDHNDPPVAVRVGLLDSAGEHGFYVADDGDGIPPEERANAFEHGYTTSDDGTGLGLAIISDIIDGHDWNIRLVESTDGGARFEITGVNVEHEK